MGRANFTASIDFKALVNELCRQGYTCYILDLSECMLMDSTFLGVMAGLALKLREPAYRNGHENVIELLNPNARNLESLESLGVMHLFKVVNGANRLAAELTEHEAVPPGAAPSREEVTQQLPRSAQAFDGTLSRQCFQVQGSDAVSGGEFEEDEAGRVTLNIWLSANVGEDIRRQLQKVS